MATVAVSLTPATIHPVYVCLLVTYSICCTLSRCTVCYNPASCHLPTTEESWEEGHEAESLEPKRNAFMGGEGNVTNRSEFHASHSGLNTYYYDFWRFYCKLTLACTLPRWQYTRFFLLMVKKFCHNTSKYSFHFSASQGRYMWQT